MPGVDTAGSKGGVVVNRYSKLDAQFLHTLAVDTQGDAIVKIAINSGDAAVQNNFSVVKIETPPDNPQPARLSQFRRPVLHPSRRCRPLCPTPYDTAYPTCCRRSSCRNN